MSVVLVALVASNAMVIAGNTMTLRGLPSRVFRDREEVLAMDWLSQRVHPSDVVLTSYETGTYLPARARVRVFVGQGPESGDTDKKKRLLAQFFDGRTEDSWREDLLREYDVDTIFWGPTERDLGGFDAGKVDYLESIYEQDGYVVLEVVR